MSLSWKASAAGARAGPPASTHRLRPARWVAIASAALIAAAGCSGGEAAGKAEEIVFASARDGVAAVYAVDASVGLIRRLTNSEGSDTAPAWSPNRRLIAFLSNRNGTPNIWLMDAAGQSERLAFPDEQGPVTGFFWAPDSRRISYEAARDGKLEAMAGDVATGRSTLLARHDAGVQLGGWSPDGVWVLYAVLDGPERGIYRRNPAGVDAVRLTTGPDRDPRWSPRGSHIAFSRRAEDGTLDIVVVTRDGQDEKLVTPGGLNETDFDWSPDGSRIAFVSDRDGNPEIYVVTADGKKLERLTSNRATDASPRWSRNGKAVLFISDSDGDMDLYTMRPDGSGQTKVVDTDQDERQPNW